jgi:hypothetical protein
MILENITSSLLASIMALSSVGGAVDSIKAAIPEAKAQVSQSTSTSYNNNWNWNWGDWMGAKPVINDINPEEGPTGTTVTLTGKRFDDDNIVRFGQGAIHNPVVSNNGKTLSFTIPEEMDKYCPPWKVCTLEALVVTEGVYNVRVQDGNKTSNSVQFEVTDDGIDPSDPLLITGIEGPSALDVGEEGTWTVDVESEGEGNLQYSVKWGDENWSPLRLFSLNDSTQSSATFTHIYDDEGTYTPEFKVTDQEGNEVTATTTVVVGDDEENAVPAIVSLNPTSAKSGATVTITGTGFDESSTTVMVGTTSALNVDVVSDTQITFKVPALALATYPVKVTDNDGTSNSVNLKIVDGGKISISGVNAPTRLQVGQEGTWTVNALSNSSGNLTYSVDWGEHMMARMMTSDEMTQSSATFTHTYEEAGTYYPKFTVTDENGKKATVSASVVVEQDND